MSSKEVISWDAPIVPSVSMAGINLGMHVSLFVEILSRHVVDQRIRLYQFKMSPVLQLIRTVSTVEDVYLFKIHNSDLINWRLLYESADHAGADPRALAVVVREDKVYAIKIWDFEKRKEGESPKYIYRGKLPWGIGLGDSLGDLNSHVKLLYDDVEECFYTDGASGSLEVTGGRIAEDYAMQNIRTICVIAENFE